MTLDMKRIILTLTLALAVLTAAVAQVMPDAPFGWATSTSLTSGDSYELTGGDPARTVILQSNGLDMREDILKSLKDYDVIVFDGSRGDFIVSSLMVLDNLRSKTLLGINNARIRTQFQVTPELKKLLDDTGVKGMSTGGGGGVLSNGIRVGEERETHTRQAIIDQTGDSRELYRNSGLFQLSRCENFIIRNLALEGPGPIDVGGADLLTVSNGSTHIWVDHCSFTDGMDGNFDINSRADFITVSWCIFQYTDKAYDHCLTNLIGSNDSPSQGVDNLNVTFAYCVWGNGCQGRMPMVRQGNIHLLNDYYNCPGSGTCVNPRAGSEVLVEGCYFAKGVKNIFSTSGAKGWAFKNNIYREKFTPEDGGTVEPFPYKYTTVPASRIPNLTKQAGPTLKLSAPESSVKFTVHLLGDSTMADKNIANGNPERGWGMVFENFVDPQVRVINYAKNGRSTKSAIDEGIWDHLMANLQAGDYVFVQFAHNDEKENSPDRYAAPWGAYQENLRRFIRETREKGATPVLLTPVARREFNMGRFNPDSHGDYPAAMRAVAAETGTTLIDMTEATNAWIAEAGDMASRPYFMWIDPGVNPAYPQGRQDNTHSNPRGARRNCDIVCDSIRVKLPELAAHLVRYDAVVDQQGRGDYLTIQEAVDAMPDYLTRKQNTILVKPGVYHERVTIPASKANLKIVGCGAENTVLSYDNYALKLYPDTKDQMGTFGSSTLYIDANDVTFEDITIANTSGRGEVVGQALAMTVNGDRVFFHRCRILGHQDTIYTHGHYGYNGNACRYYFLDCYIEGTTDFIFGQGTGLFENCLIRSKKNSHVTAASTLQGQKYGYVFRHCKFIADEGVDNVSLGRPWKDYARVVYLECELGAHIRPAGWDNWGSAAKEKTAYYAEYKNFGPGAKPESRVAWAHQLTDEEAAEYTFEKIMAAPGEFAVWNPLNK